jgi:4a-hydroxytetrahydrobiopterin dehydratase
MVDKFSKILENKKHSHASNVMKILSNLGYSDFRYKYSTDGIYSFTDGKDSILVIDPDKHIMLQHNIEKELDEEVKELNGYKFYIMYDTVVNNPWFENLSSLDADFVFDNFKEVKRFITGILELSTEQNHYPCISYDSYNVVKVKLYTHDTNGITKDDYKLAIKITKLYNSI